MLAIAKLSVLRSGDAKTSVQRRFLLSAIYMIQVTTLENLKSGDKKVRQHADSLWRYLTSIRGLDETTRDEITKKRLKFFGEDMQDVAIRAMPKPLRDWFGRSAAFTFSQSGCCEGTCDAVPAVVDRWSAYKVCHSWHRLTFFLALHFRPTSVEGWARRHRSQLSHQSVAEFGIEA